MRTSLKVALNSQSKTNLFKKPAPTAQKQKTLILNRAFLRNSKTIKSTGGRPPVGKPCSFEGPSNRATNTLNSNEGQLPKQSKTHTNETQGITKIVWNAENKIIKKKMLTNKSQLTYFHWRPYWVQNLGAPIGYDLWRPLWVQSLCAPFGTKPWRPFPKSVNYFEKGCLRFQPNCDQ
jgi:hypothetical protein